MQKARNLKTVTGFGLFIMFYATQKAYEDGIPLSIIRRLAGIVVVLSASILVLGIGIAIGGKDWGVVMVMASGFFLLMSSISWASYQDPDKDNMGTCHSEKIRKKRLDSLERKPYLRP